MSHPLSKEAPTAARYWMSRFCLEHGMDSPVYRRRPEEPGDWVEVELALVPTRPRAVGMLENVYPAGSD